MIPYYEKHGIEYTTRTSNLNVDHLYELFNSYIQPGMTIADIGFGSARDSKHFSTLGYHVTAIDSSALMCKQARMQHLPNVRVLQNDFMNLNIKVDAIWCCACLVHSPDLKQALDKLTTFTSGPILVSLKIGDTIHTVSDVDRIFYIVTQDYVRDVCMDLGLVVHEWSTNISTLDANVEWLTIVVSKV